jgi:hypothetical protein
MVMHLMVQTPFYFLWTSQLALRLLIGEAPILEPK